MELQIHLTFFFSSRRRHTRLQGDWSSDVCSSDLAREEEVDSPAMAFSIDTSPARQFVEHLSAGTTPAIWMWQVAVAATAVLLEIGRASGRGKRRLSVTAGCGRGRESEECSRGESH